MVLRREDGRRDEHRDLLAVLGRLECGADRDLGLAVPDVADDEPVHRPDRLHVVLDLDGGAELVDRLLVRKRRLHLGLPGRVARVGVARRGGPRGVQREQLLGEVADGLPDARLRPQPLRAAELRERRALAAGVARDPPDLLDRHEDPVLALERELEEVALVARARAAPEHPLVARDAVVDVDDEVAGREALEDVPGHDPAHRLRPADADVAEQLAVGDEDEAVRPAVEPAVQAPVDHRHGARRWRLRDRVRDAGRVAALLEELREARRLVRGDDDAGARFDAPAVLAEPADPPLRRCARRGPAAASARASRTGRRWTSRRPRSRRTPPTPR